MSTDGDEMAGRKAKHLEICLDPVRYQVEGPGAGFESLSFLHRAMPELGVDEVDLSTDFLGRRVKLPFFISSMTGGSEAAYGINKSLAQAAQELGIAVGMGSNRILFKKPEVFDHFYLRPLAPDVPILSNLGAVQLLDMDHQSIFEMNKRLEVDAQIIHLNPGQELFQPQGDRDFRGVKAGLTRFIKASPLPVIVKETGFGIAPDEVAQLLDAGAEFIDLAGGGGTNWLSVEAYRDDAEALEASREFIDWGYPTALLLAALGDSTGRVLASGGIRSGLDIAKSLALGAHLAGLALPFARAVSQGGAAAVVKLARRYETVLRTALVLTGKKSIRQLSGADLMMTRDFEHSLQQLKAAFGL